MPLRFLNLSDRTILWVAAVLLTVFVSFLPALDNDFVNWDDDVHLLENRAVRSLSVYDIQQLFNQTINYLYIPLTSLSFAVEYHFSGYDPFVYHLNNLLLHVFNTGMIFAVATMLGLSRVGALLTAFIFGVHPLHVESVAWVTERKDVLYAAFYMSAVVLYLRYINGGSKRLFWGSWFCGLLSMLAKPMALSLPLILLLFDWYFKRQDKRWLIEKMYFAVYVLPVAWLSYVWHARVPFEGWASSFLTWLWCFAFYIKKFIFPDPLLPIYQLPLPVALTHTAYWSSFLIFMAVLVSVLILRRNRLYLFAVGFYAASMFFIWRFDAFDANIVGDRFLYLPMFGFCLIAGMFFEKILLTAQNNRYYLAAAAVGLACVFGWLIGRTQAQCDVWQNGVSLWKHQMKTAPAIAPALVYHKLGHAKTKQKKFQDTAARLKAFYQGRTDAFDPEDIRRAKKLISWQERALALKPGMTSAYFVIGQIYQDVGRPQDAEAVYRTLLAHDPNFFLAYVQLGRLYQEYGMLYEALAAYASALKINSYNPYFVAEIEQAREDILQKL